MRLNKAVLVLVILFVWSPTVLAGDVLNRPPVQDTFVDQSDPSGNFGSETSLIAGTQAGSAQAILLEFDLSDVPQNAVVDFAILSFERVFTTHTGDFAVSLRYRPVNWIEDSVTWNSSGVDSDPIAGGASLDASLSFPAISGGTFEAMVQDWISNPASNHGMTIFPAVDTGTVLALASNESTSNPPRLSVDYSVPAAPPSLETFQPEDVTENSATLRGAANPEGSSTSVYFEYGPFGSFDQQTSAQSVGSGTDFVNFDAQVDLECATIYQYRAVGSNETGQAVGDSVNFTTAECAPSEPPSMETYQPEDVTESSATLRGAANPQGTSTTVYFEYGPSGSYNQQTPAQAVGSGTDFVDFNAPIDNLECSTNYQYRAVGSNDGGSATGGNQNFATAECAPTEFELFVSSIGASGVVISSPTAHSGTTPYTAVLTEGEDVELTAPPSHNGEDFLEWRGCDASIGNTCNLMSVGSDRQVTVVYGDAIFRDRFEQ